MGVVISELEKYPVKGLVLDSADPNADKGEIYKSLAFVSGTICNTLLEKNVPHNLIFSNNGKTIYIIPRQFHHFQDETKMKAAFMEIAGVAICRNQELYEKITATEFEEILKKDVCLEDDKFNKIRDDMLGIFKKTFK